MDFNPNLEPEDFNLPSLSSDSNDDNIPTQKDILSITNLLAFTQDHARQDREVRKELEDVKYLLSFKKDMMSMKELIDYYKVLIKEREFLADCILKAYNYIIKTEVAKEMLLGTNRKSNIEDAEVDNNKIKKLMTYFMKDPNKRL